MNTAIKICGITRETEIEMLNRSRIEYAGFVLYKPSRRYIKPGAAAKLKSGLTQDTKSVAVTVCPSQEELAEIEEAGFDAVQIHGVKDYDLLDTQLQTVHIPVWLAFQVGAEKIDIHGWSSSIEGILLDAAQYGSGRTFDWERLEQKELLQWQNLQLILAGGLTPLNVRSGIEKFHPDIVDVSSSMENGHGKEEQKIIDFVRKVRELER